MRVIRSLLIVAVACIGLSGCAEMIQAMPYAIQGVQSANAGANAPRSDADMISMKLTAPTTPDLFVENAKTTVKRFGYEISSISGSGPIRVVVATKRRMDTGIVFAFSRREVTYITVMMQLEQDGRTIQVSSQNTSNTGEGAPGAAKKVVEEFKENLLQLYAANK